jgi:hypothetical protein
MTHPAVATQVHQALDVHCHFTAQIALDGKFAQSRANSFDLGLSQIPYFGFRVHTGSCTQFKCARATHTIDVRQTRPSVFLYWNVDSCYASHAANSLIFAVPLKQTVYYIEYNPWVKACYPTTFSRSTLSLLVLFIRADNEEHTFATHYLAVTADLFY